MNSQEIRELTNAEIIEKIKETQNALTRLKLNHAVSAIESPAAIRSNRRAIARMKTILTQQQAKADAAN